MDKTIRYICFYDEISNHTENRNFALSAVNKINYICKVLNDTGYKVQIVSPSWTTKNKFYKGKKKSILDNVELVTFPTLPWGKNFLKLISVIFSFSYLIVYLLFNLKKNEEVIVYHSKWMSVAILILKKLRNDLVIILEVEEIYDDVKKSKLWRHIEYKLFKKADKYIFPTILLNEKLNTLNKPYIIVHGTYQVESDRKSKFNDGRIHVVYAGTFDLSKGGAAAAAAEYLDEGYHIHIIGFGTDKEKKYLLDLISRVSKRTKCKITYDGLLRGEDYIRFLQSCDLGLSTQIPNAEYNDTSFPSKVLSYMANGLRVLSIRIKVLEKSSVNNLLFYYDIDSPQEIAKAITHINFKDHYDSRQEIYKLNQSFKQEIKILLESPNE